MKRDVGRYQASELRELGNEELLAKLREAKEELFNLRFQAATGQLENHGRLKAVRKDIARIYTLMRERELGIETASACATTEEGRARLACGPRPRMTAYYAVGPPRRTRPVSDRGEGWRTRKPRRERPKANS
ncbi:hypothetical protein STENM327S_01103 [Streptomyces tendae]